MAARKDASGGTYPAEPLDDAAVAKEREAAAKATTPMMAKCRTCDHEWVVVYLPMSLDRVGVIAAAAYCPKGCSTRPSVLSGGAAKGGK